MTQAILTIPASAKKGEVIDVRALIAHGMESGFRPGNDGKTLPRNIISHVECHYLGQLACAITLHPSVAANPYIGFHLRASSSGTIEVRWTGDNGFTHVERATLNVV